jgi:hypothetical protein
MRPEASLRDWRERLREPSLSVVVALQVLLMFVAGPLAGAHVVTPRVIPLFVLLIALVSILVAKRRVERLFVIVTFGATFMFAGLRTVFPTPKAFIFTETAAELLFLATISAIIARAVFNDGRVTLHRIQGAIAIYLNTALIFGMLDNLIVTQWPGAFSNLSPEEGDHIGEMIYFSLTTLTTTGYGDLAPVHPLARGVANLESVVGQLYLATMVATLVGLHVYGRNTAGRQKPTDESNQ